MSRKSPDIRQPCGGKNQPVYIGGCGNQRNSKNHAYRLINTTKVPDYASGSTATIDPYGRAERATSPACSPYDQEVFDCGDGLNGNKYCGIPDTGSFIYSGNLIPLGAGYFNSYGATTESVDYSYCKVFGGKKVYANKAWQGRYAYNARIIGAQDEMTWCCSCATHNFDSAKETTKYLSISSNVYHHTHTKQWEVVTTTEGDNICTSRGEVTNETDHTAEVSIACHYDKFGNYTQDVWEGVWTGFDAPDDPAGLEFLTDAFEKSTLANNDINTIIGIFCDPENFPPDISTTGKGSNQRYEWQSTNRCTDAMGEVTSEDTYTSLAFEIDLAAGTLTIETYGTATLPYCTGDGSCLTIINTSTTTYTFHGTTMSYVLDAHSAPSVSFDSTEHYEVNGTLGSPYTVQEVEATAQQLMGYWPLDNDIILPWRTELDNVGPLVSYNEIQAAPSIDPFISSSLQMPGGFGDILGLPGPLGIDRIWNPKHANYYQCGSPGDEDICYVLYTQDWGAWSDSVGIPHATQWIDKWHAKQCPQGAFVGMDFIYSTPSTCNFDAPPHVINDDIVRVAKYAEVVMPQRRSYNYARPCGIDRFQMLKDSNRCITEVSESVLTLEPAGDATDISFGDLIWICGTEIDGCYKAASASDHQITLGQCVISASAFPDVPLTDCGAGIVGKLRWQILPSGICGRVDIASVSQNSPVTASLAEPQYLTSSDKIIVQGAQGAQINGLWSINVIDPSTIVLVGSHGVNTPYSASSGQAFCPGAADWRWNDNAPKHDYVPLQWFMTYRDTGEYNRIAGYNASEEIDCQDSVTPCPVLSNIPEPRASQVPVGLAQEVYSIYKTTACQPVSGCHPIVAFYSPNGETFSRNPNVMGAVNHGFPSVTPDGQYGGIFWNGIVKQTDNDPLWQVPPCPCSDNGFGTLGCFQDPFEDLPFREDDGSCEFGAYAHAPQVESRGDPVDGSPATPKGVYVGYLTPAEIAAGKIHGNILNPPEHDGNANMSDAGAALVPLITYPPYYSLWAAEQNCVCFGGIYSDIYSKDGVSCS